MHFFKSRIRLFNDFFFEFVLSLVIVFKINKNKQKEREYILFYFMFLFEISRILGKHFLVFVIKMIYAQQRKNVQFIFQVERFLFASFENWENFTRN